MKNVNKGPGEQKGVEENHDRKTAFKSLAVVEIDGFSSQCYCRQHLGSDFGTNPICKTLSYPKGGMYHV